MTEPTIKDEAKERFSEPLLPIEKKLIGWKSRDRSCVVDRIRHRQPLCSLLAAENSITMSIDKSVYQERFMFHAYIVEVGEEAVGVVARETNGYRFYAAKQSFRSLEGRSLRQRRKREKRGARFAPAGWSSRIRAHVAEFKPTREQLSVDQAVRLPECGKLSNTDIVVTSFFARKENFVGPERVAGSVSSLFVCTVCKKGQQ